MMRYVWRIEPLASMNEDQLVAAVAPNLQHYIQVTSVITPVTGPLGVAR